MFIHLSSHFNQHVHCAEITPYSLLYYSVKKKQIKFVIFQSRSVGGHATTSQNQGNETHSSVKATASAVVTKNRRDLVWINPSLKKQLQAHIQKNMSNKQRGESTPSSTIMINNNNKYVVNNIKSSTNDESSSVISNKTSTENLTTLTSTSESDHLHTTTTNEEIFVKPRTTTTPHKKFIKRNKTELKFVRRPQYDRSKFKYVAPSHKKLINSDSISDECKDRDKEPPPQQDIVE